MSTLPKTCLVAGDVGGTKTRLGLFVPGKTRPRILCAKTYASNQAGDLGELVLRFLGNRSEQVVAACFGVPGPVLNGRCRTTNLPWEVSERGLRRRFGWKRVRLINDVQATALALPLLRGRELFSLQGGRADPRGLRVLVAPGTGLGLALVLPSAPGFRALPSEGGHADFAPRNEREVDLHRYLSLRFGHVSLERVLSGPGLAHIYSWLRDTKPGREPAWLAEALNTRDPAEVISQAALSRKDARCVRALEIFTEILGATAGNLALTAMATGGVYLGGGIPPKILPVLKGQGFAKAFADKGRFREWARKIPVRVILNDAAALLGSAQHAGRSTSEPRPR
ncbi:MAG: glucokinase [Deltaproteobacteria bacterium]|nr:glucokinase [Deltaproteobacteria bacterium]